MLLVFVLILIRWCVWCSFSFVSVSVCMVFLVIGIWVLCKNSLFFIEDYYCIYFIFVFYGVDWQLVDLFVFYCQIFVYYYLVMVFVVGYQLGGYFLWFVVVVGYYGDFLVGGQSIEVYCLVMVVGQLYIVYVDVCLGVEVLYCVDVGDYLYLFLVKMGNQLGVNVIEQWVVRGQYYDVVFGMGFNLCQQCWYIGFQCEVFVGEVGKLLEMVVVVYQCFSGGDCFVCGWDQLLQFCWVYFYDC